jgi:hypothetical protein
MYKKSKLNNIFFIFPLVLIIIATLFFKLSPVSSATLTVPVKTVRPNINISVPFTSQAPLGQWKDERQQDGCEEASAAMAMAWVGNEKNISRENWRLRILILSNF